MELRTSYSLIVVSLMSTKIDEQVEPIPGDAYDGFSPNMFLFKISLFSNSKVASLLVE